MLKISADLSLPLDAVTQSFAILAKRRVGKTYTASVMAEEFVKASLPFVAIDPTGAWHGLRASADGKGPGLPVVVIGGAHGDLPLDPDGGATIAELVVEHPGYYILDLSSTRSNAEQDRFCLAFAERLYRLKQANRTPLHLFLDEADAVVPQKPQRGQERMLGAFEALVRRGGIYGIGVSLISQRPAVINKNVLSQCEVLIALQTTSPHDQDAIKDWASRNGTPEQLKALMASLASLGKGEAWFWSPAWIETFEKVRIRARHTFNSSATPKVGEKRVEPKRLAEVDLAALRVKLAATIEKAKAEDPKALRAQVVSLTNLLEKKADAPIPSYKETIVNKSVEVSILKDAHVKRIEVAVCRAETLNEKTIAALAEVARLLKAAAPKQVVFNYPTVRVDPKMPRDRIELRHPVTDRVQSTIVNVGDGPAIGSSHIKIMDSIAWLEQLGIAPCSRAQAAVFSGMTPNGGYYARLIGELKTAGLAVYPGTGMLALTSAGSGRASPGNAPQTNEALHADVLGRLSASQRRILAALIQDYPEAPSRGEIAQDCDMDAAGGYFARLIGELKTMGLIDYPSKGAVRAAEILFIKGA